MTLVNDTLARLKCLRLPVVVLAICVGWFPLALAQVSAPTQQLFQAVNVNDMEAVKKAISAGADLGAKNTEGKTAADIAVDKGHFIIAHYLLSERSAKNTAKRMTNTAPEDVLDRRRKPSSKSAAVSLSKPAKPKAVTKSQPRRLSPAKPDTATRVTSFLEPVKPKPKPAVSAPPAKTRQYGFPPRKPKTIAAMEQPIQREVTIGASPGVDKPDGREPVGRLSEAPPKAMGAPSAARLDDEDDLIAAETVEPSDTPEQNVAASSGNPVARIGNFFKAIVDLVVPSDSNEQGQQQEMADTQPEPASSSSDPEAEADLLADDGLQASPDPDNDESGIDGDALAEMDDPLEPLDDEAPMDDMAASDPDLMDNNALEDEELQEQDVESDDALGLEELSDEPERDLAQAPKNTASERTLDRIKSLLGDGPAEDEFGLPEVDIPTRETATGADAVDTVLDRLADSEDATAGFLDDTPGPDTGPGAVLSSDDQINLPVSSAMRSRLQRLGDAVSRDVVVDTNSILQRGRDRSRDALEGPLEQRATRPRQSSSRSSQQILNDTASPDSRLRHRKTASERFAERLKRIKELEQLREDPFGIPIGGTRTPVRKLPVNREPANKAGTSVPIENAPVAEENKGDEKEPELLDRVASFFGGSKPRETIQEAPAPVDTDMGYRDSPNARPDIVRDAGPAPEIENLEAFDQDDETRPEQQPGSLEPVFLERLAGLFNEEEENQTEGWEANVEVGSPFPGRGELVNKTGVDPWTTTVELNVGADKEPVVIQVAQTPDPELESFPDIQSQKSSDGSAASTPASRSRGKPSEMAKKAYGDPLREPDAEVAEAKQKTFFGRLTKLFQPKDPAALARESLLLEQDEKLSTAHDVADGSVKVASRTESTAKTYWPITNLTKSDPPVSGHRGPRALTRTSLSDVTLTMGESVNLDNIFPPGRDGTDPSNECVKKNRGTTLFCIEPIDWPQDIRQSFVITTILYTGPMAIVRFDQAAATRLHSLFRSDDFDQVIAYYQNRFGEPTEILKRSIAPLAKPRQDNPTVSWRSRDETTNAVTVLEIRKFDDTRGGFPDTNRGAVMLYFSTSPSIFPQVSSHELMRLKRIVDVTQTEDEQNASKANALDNQESPPGDAAVSSDELFGSEPLPDEGLPSEQDTTLNDLSVDDSELFPEEQLERPEDILNEPSLEEPDLTEPDLLAPETVEPDQNANDNSFINGLSDEPITDEQPDEIIEIPPLRNPNPS